VQGVVKQDTTNGEVIYTVAESLATETDTIAAEEEAEAEGASSAELALLAEMKVYESYITGMLTTVLTIHCTVLTIHYTLYSPYRYAH
jgi:hypothetical protein